MDQKVIFIVFLICHFVLTKEYIANSNIKEIIRKCSFFISIHCDIRFGIQLSGNPSRQIIQLNTIQMTLPYCFRQHSKKVTDPHRRL